MEILELTDTLNMTEANRFEEALRDDEYFTHFKHTTALQQAVSPYWDVFMYMVDKKVVGWEQIQYFPEPAKAHIARLGFAVLPEYRGRGICAEMLKHAIQHCYDSGYTKLEATSRLDNIPMVVNFIKAEFHIEGCFQNAVSDRHVVSWAKFI